MPDQTEVQTSLLEILSEESGFAIEDIDINLDLKDNLDLDSLSMINIISALEDKYSTIRMEINDYRDCRTVKELSNRFNQVLAGTVPQC
jgi:acyl carrier protein